MGAAYIYIYIYIYIYDISRLRVDSIPIGYFSGTTRFIVFARVKPAKTGHGPHPS